MKNFESIEIELKKSSLLGAKASDVFGLCGRNLYFTPTNN